MQHELSIYHVKFKKMKKKCWFWKSMNPKNSFIFSKVVKCTWKIGNRLNRKKNQISDFSDFYFSSYHRKLGWFFHKNDTKMTITREEKIGEFRNLDLLSIQPIANLSCKFKKKKIGFWRKSMMVTVHFQNPIFFFFF